MGCSQSNIDTAVNPESRSLSEKLRKEIKEIGIDPEQFIVENTRDICIDYSFKGKIGKGTYGVVYKAMQNSSKNVRAIKVIEKSDMSARSRKILYKEIEILRKLDHPNIVKLYEFYSDPKYYYLVTEFVEGGELFEEIHRRNYFSEKIASHIMKQILSAIMYCHKMGIMHRDLKSSNILIEKIDAKDSFDIKVIDFGNAEMFSPNSYLKEITGTPYYIAPEVLENHYNEKCDIWSAGVLLYMLLSGSPPFYGSCPLEVIEKVKIGHFSFDRPIWRDVSNEAKDLISKMLNHSPSSRITAEKAYDHKWINSESKSNITSQTMEELLNQLGRFSARQKLQQATLMYIGTQVMTESKKRDLTNAFADLDKNGDGLLSKEELIKGYCSLKEPHSKAKSVVEKVLEDVDVNKNGFINYSEFIVALMNKKQVVTRNNLRLAFEAFDMDKNGYLTANEVKNLLQVGKDFSEDVWKFIIEEVDQNKDGKISFSEFERMMRNFMK